jgi:hypothetical protein
MKSVRHFEGSAAMATEVHVEGRITAGGMPDFAVALEHYRIYAAEHDYAVPQALLGLSGSMNTVRLIYRYDELSRYDEHEVKAMTDRDYGKLAGAMGFVDGTINYTIYRQI